MSLLPEVLMELHGNLEQQAPGSDAATLRALALIPAPGADARILDLGCGPGRHSLVLARETGARVLAVDLLRPFLDQLEARAAAAGLGEQIETRVGSMDAVDVPVESIDLIWSEGAIYNIGFEAGLRTWHRLLRPGGHCVVSELCWITDSPPARVREFWAAAYPAMQSVPVCIAAAERAGYRCVGHFTLDPEDWWTGYYAPLRERIRSLRGKYAKDVAALEQLTGSELEIDLFEEHPDVYGYEFFALERR